MKSIQITKEQEATLAPYVELLGVTHLLEPLEQGLNEVKDFIPKSNKAFEEFLNVMDAELDTKTNPFEVID